MSYWYDKPTAERQLIDSLHGGGEETVLGLPPIEVSSPDPRKYLQQPQPVEEHLEPGWGPSIVIEDGARLIWGDIGR